MSGPKVVRIVTREEIEAICRAHIRDVEAAADAVTRVAQRLDRLNGQVEEELARQKQMLTTLFQAENWMEIQKRGPSMVANLQSYADQIRADAITAATAERAKGRRLAEAARTLVIALEKAGQSVSPQLRAAVQTAAAANPDALAAIEARINEGMRQFAAAGESAGTSSQEALGLANRLASGLTERSLEDWLATMPSPNPRDVRLDAVFAELKVLADVDTLSAYESRASKIASADDTQRALLTDSLILEASRFAAQCRSAEQMAFRLQQARGALAPLLSEDARTLASRIDASLVADDMRNGASLCEEATVITERETTILAAKSRREAVLKGLSALGYEIRGGMATAWAKDGRIIVKKPGTQDYGVELGAPGDASRLQVRLVGSDRPASVRSSERDRDQEVSWCTEFHALQANVAASGGYLAIERAIEVGAQPVKTVTFSDTPSTHETADVRPTLRTLR